MKIIVYRKGNEIFTACAESNTLEFPSGTRIERVETSGYAAIRVYLAEMPLNDGGDRNIDVSYAERVLAQKGFKIEAIKSYRGRTGTSLIEAKRAIEEFIIAFERARAEWRNA